MMKEAMDSLTEPDNQGKQESEDKSECTSIPSSDYAVGDPAPVSLTEDFKLYWEQLIRMARALELEYTSSDPKSHYQCSSLTHNP